MRIALLTLTVLSGCAVPRYSVEVPAIALVALAGGDVSKVPQDAPPLIAETVWFDRSVDISFTTPDGKTIKVSTLADAGAAVKARAKDADAISEGANAALGVIKP